MPICLELILFHKTYETSIQKNICFIGGMRGLPHFLTINHNVRKIINATINRLKRMYLIRI